LIVVACTGGFLHLWQQARTALALVVAHVVLLKFVFSCFLCSVHVQQLSHFGQVVRLVVESDIFCALSTVSPGVEELNLKENNVSRHIL